MSVFHSVPPVPRGKMERWNACRPIGRHVTGENLAGLFRLVISGPYQAYPGKEKHNCYYAYYG